MVSLIVGVSIKYTFRQLYKLWRIDYVFYSDSLKGHDCYSPETLYSDHNMVIWKRFNRKFFLAFRSIYSLLFLYVR